MVVLNSNPLQRADTISLAHNNPNKGMLAELIGLINNKQLYKS